MSHMSRGQLGTIGSWHRAVNDGAADLAGAFCTSDVEVGGPRGSGYGRELLVDWVRHAGIRMRPVRWFCGPAGAVVEQDARWVDPATGELGAPDLPGAAVPGHAGGAGRARPRPGRRGHRKRPRTADLAGVGSVSWRS